MKQKQKFIVLGAIGFVFLLFWFVVLALVIKTTRGSNKDVEMPVAEVTLCDEDASGLCIVTFGANSRNNMVINFQLPNAGYVPFYVKAGTRGMVSVYSCVVTESAPTSAYCTGVRTPLGETIEIEVYTIDEDKFVARGTFLVSAVALWTPISLPSETPTQVEVPTPIEAVHTPTATPDVSYPNP